jgi:soluble lytic murein transglycosylase
MPNVTSIARVVAAASTFVNAALVVAACGVIFGGEINAARSRRPAEPPVITPITAEVRSPRSVAGWQHAQRRETDASADAEQTQQEAPSRDTPPPTTAAPTAASTEPAPPTEKAQAPVLQSSEAKRIAAFDAYIAEVRDHVPTPEDVARLKEVAQSMATGAGPAGKTARDQIADPVARKLAEWMQYRQGVGTAREIKAFVDANPDWPLRDTLMTRAEEQLFTSGGSAREIKAFFNGSEPRSGVGHAALASALLAEGDTGAAAKLAAQTWRHMELAATLEVGFLDRFGRLLSEADHKARFDRLLLDDSRWTNERSDRAAVARRVMTLMSSPVERQKAEARLAVYLRAKTADHLMSQLSADGVPLPPPAQAPTAGAKPAAGSASTGKAGGAPAGTPASPALTQNTAQSAGPAPQNALPGGTPEPAATTPDWGFQFQRAQWLRRQNRHEDAWKILLAAPRDAAVSGNPDDWWDERRYAAYDALKQGKAAQAYDLVKEPGALSVNPQKDAAFFAGWIAFKHLGRPVDAIPHFLALEKAADGPLSRAKAAYWLARVYEATGQTAKVRSQLESAAKNSDTFYGLLAMQELEPGKTRLVVPPPAEPASEVVQRFNSRDIVRATVIARKAGLDTGIVRAFLNQLRIALAHESEQAMVAHLADALGDTQMAVRIAKSSVARGLNMIPYAYPIHAMPAYQPLRPPPEPALLLGVARQESEFNTNTMSGAGARGLLQVMPITARHVCTDYRIKCDIDRLVKEPAYNAMMASAYIGDRMDEFAGSYVLTIAGYNAGPGRARQWVREFGDPRDPKVDPVDWINRIPFEETREYVQKVLANIQIYRARLGDEETALQLKSDLRRTGNGNVRRAAAGGG